MCKLFYELPPDLDYRNEWKIIIIEEAQEKAERTEDLSQSNDMVWRPSYVMFSGTEPLDSPVPDILARLELSDISDQELSPIRHVSNRTQNQQDEREIVAGELSRKTIKYDDLATHCKQMAFSAALL